MKPVRRAAPYVGLALLVLLLAWATVRPTSGPALDPRSTAPDGTAALVATLERLGARVELARTPQDLAGADRVLGLTVPPTEAWNEALTDAAEAGATVVTTAPAADVSTGFVPPVGEPRCAVPGLDAVGEVSRLGTRSFVVDPEADTGDAGGEAVPAACFPAGNEAAWLVARPVGAGVEVGLGDFTFLTNRVIDEADNAVLAAVLTDPGPDTTIAVVGPDAAIGEGERSLTDLVPDRVRHALLQLAIGLLVAVAWRSRRLGPPVEEPLPVELEASELVRATGGMLEARGAHADAAARLSAALHRDLARRVGLPPDATADRVASAAAPLLGRPADAIEALLTAPAGGRVGDADALVRHARDVARLRAAAGPVPAHPDHERPTTGASR